MLIHTTRSALVALVAFAVAASAAPSLSLKLSGADNVDGVNNLKVTTTVTNTGNETLKLLNDPRGPLDDLPTDTFLISRDGTGTAPVFTGVLVKYTPASAAKFGGEDSYTILVPSQSISLEHDLSTAYNFTTSGEGIYNISSLNQFYYLDETNAIVQLVATMQDSAAHVVNITGKLAVAPITKVKRATFVSCSDDEQAVIIAAADAAHNLVDDALAYTSALDGPTPRYTQWFGAYSAAHFNTVLTIFENLYLNDYTAYQYDCTCTRTGVYAYSNRNVFGAMNICDLFWTSPLTGTDSQAGTIIHESTHFIANAGTQDYADGQAECIALASNPNQAVNNGDSYAYYAENNPYLA